MPLPLRVVSSPTAAEGRRLAPIAWAEDGIRQDERRQLIQLAGISPEDQDAIINLFYLNVTLLQGTSKGKRHTKKTGGGEGYDVSRYVPPLKRVLEELLTTVHTATGPQPATGGAHTAVVRHTVRSSGRVNPLVWTGPLHGRISLRCAARGRWLRQRE